MHEDNVPFQTSTRLSLLLTAVKYQQSDPIVAVAKPADHQVVEPGASFRVKLESEREAYRRRLGLDEQDFRRLELGMKTGWKLDERSTGPKLSLVEKDLSGWKNRIGCGKKRRRSRRMGSLRGFGGRSNRQYAWGFAVEGSIFSVYLSSISNVRLWIIPAVR